MKFGALCTRAALTAALVLNVPSVLNVAAAQDAAPATQQVSKEAATVTVGGAKDSGTGWAVISTPTGHRLVRVSPNWLGRPSKSTAPPTVATGDSGGSGTTAGPTASETMAPVLFGPPAPAVEPSVTGGGSTGTGGATTEGLGTSDGVVQGTTPMSDGPRPLLLGAAYSPEQEAAGVTPPAAPIGLVVQPGSGGEIHVSWQDQSTNESAFEVMRQRQAGSNWNRSTTIRVNADTTAMADAPGNGTYRYRVRAVNGAGESAFTPWGMMQVAGQAPAAPSQVTASDLGNGTEVRLTWADNSADETSFEIERETLSGSVWGGRVTLAAGANQTSYTDSASIGTFRYRMRSVNSAGSSVFSAWATVTVDVVVPAAPTNLQASDQGNEWHLRLTWSDNSANESGFQIERQILSSGTWGPAVTIWVQANVATYTDSVGVGTFRYRARAMNSHGSSAFTAWTQGTIASQTPQVPAAPTGAMASDIGNRRALVSWTDASDNETRFEIERSPSFSTGLVSVGANVVGYIDQSGPGDFSYRVRAVGTAGTSAFSSWANVTVAEIAPTAPTSLQSAAQGSDGVTLTWVDTSNNESGFRIERQTQGAGGTWGSVTTLTAVADATGLSDSPGSGTHRYRVAATNFAGDSPFTAWSTVSLTGGWTELTPSADTRIIYVSSSTGNDSNDGLAQNRPVRTIVRGMALIRDGYPDWLLLKRGDTFDESAIVWTKNGRSEAERMVFGAYGSSSSRPLIRTGTGNFLNRWNHENRGNHLAIVGLHATPHTFTGGGNPIGINWSGAGANLLIEDCRFDGYATNAVIQRGLGNPSNVKIRRSVFTNAYSSAAHSQGLYCEGVNGLLVEECVFDRNGWNPSVPDAEPTVFNHNVYIDNKCNNVVVRGCIIARGSSHGLQLRPGGVAENNLIVRNALSLLLGGGDPDDTTHVNGITGVLRGNVILEGTNITPEAPRGMGIDIANVGSNGAVVEHNIVAHKAVSTNGFVLSLSAASYGSGVGVNNVAVRDNIFYNWRGPVQVVAPRSSPPAPSTYTSVSGNTFSGNDFQDGAGSTASELMQSYTGQSSSVSFNSGTYHSSRSASSWFRLGSTQRSFPQWVTDTGESNAQALAISYTDPNRSVASYNASIGGSSSLEAFLNEAKLQSRTNWRQAYTADAVNDYIRAGFDHELP